MSDIAVAEVAQSEPGGVRLPEAVRAAANGELDGQTVVAWAEYDLDEANRYARRYAILTEQKLVLLAGLHVDLSPNPRLPLRYYV